MTNETTNEKARKCCGGRRSVLLPALCVVLRPALGGLFLLAAYNKLFVKNGPQLFSESIKAFKVFDPVSQGNLIQLATYVTPWIEVLASVALIIGLWTRAAAAVIGVLLIGFMGLIVSALLRKLNVECGCFGDISPFCPAKIGACNLIQNTVMLAAAALIILNPRQVLADDVMGRGCGCT